MVPTVGTASDSEHDATWMGSTVQLHCGGERNHPGRPVGQLPGPLSRSGCPQASALPGFGRLPLGWGI
eukprot:3422395-Rhodomonas_salina.1